MDLFSEKISKSKLRVLLMQISVLLNSGVDIEKALYLVSKRSNSQFLQDSFHQILLDMYNGKKLSAAMKRHKNIFPKDCIGFIEVGEKCGKVSVSLDFISNEIKEDEESRRKFVQIVSYPVFIAIICFGLIFFALPFIADAFSSLYSGFDAELPAITVFIINISRKISTIFPFVLLFIVITALIVYFACKYSKTFRLYCDKLLTKLPYYGGFLRDRMTIRFIRFLSWLHKTNCKTEEIFEIIANSCTNTYYKSVIDYFPQLISSGNSFSSIINHYNIFSPVFCEMIIVFEGYGNIYESLEDCIGIIETENEARIEFIIKFLSPTLFILLATLVFFIVLALVMPIFSLNTVIPM